MAKVLFNSALVGIRGRVGDLIFRRSGKGTVVYVRPAPSSLPPSPAQRAQRERFTRVAQARAAARRLLPDGSVASGEVEG